VGGELMEKLKAKLTEKLLDACMPLLGKQSGVIAPCEI